MNCPDWPHLLSDRERRERSGRLEPSAAWKAAAEHMPGCASCRLTAIDLDASLLFQSQPAIEVSDDEIDAIRANVRTLRRSRAAERRSGESRRRLGRVAAAAAVVSLMVLLPTHNSRQPAPVVSGANLAADASLPIPGTLVFGDGPAPVIEPLDLPAARIYQLGADDLSVVMVVDESIDV